MSENDSCCLTSVLLPAVLALVGFLYLYKNGNKLQKKFFAFIFMRLSKGYNTDLDAAKTELFAELKTFQSLDATLRQKGQVRILEVGVGPGSNFKYYPKNARLIAVDPNPYFRQYLEENSAKFPDVDLEQVVLGAGEDLSEVKDGSVDVVITTIVLCSVKDVERVLKEIKRVLAPGGKYFFLEHILGPRGSSYRRLQTFLNPVWPTLFDGCHLTRDIPKTIDQANFSKTNYKTFIAPMKSIFVNVVGPHIVGNVQK